MRIGVTYSHKVYVLDYLAANNNNLDKAVAHFYESLDDDGKKKRKRQI